MMEINRADVITVLGLLRGAACWVTKTSLKKSYRKNITGRWDDKGKGSDMVTFFS